MRTVPARSEPETVERLRGDEASLERQIAAARAAAAELLREAHLEAERIGAEGLRSAEAERDRIRGEAAVRAEAARAEAASALNAEVAELSARAARYRARAVARALEIVTGSDA